MYYWVYGFALKSDFELPELRDITREEAEAGPPPMVEIVNGPVPEALPGERRLATWFSHAGRSCLYSIPEVGRLLVEEGCRVTVDMDRGAQESDMRTYLLGSGLGTTVHQRGLIPLHISAVHAPGGAIAFTGPSGAGKSTLAMCIHKERGWPIVTDDVAVLTVQENSAWIEGGVRRTRLWRDALDRLDIPIDGLMPDFHNQEKYQVISYQAFENERSSLSALIELNHYTRNNPQFVCDADRFTVMANSIYRPFLVRLLQDQASVTKYVSQACSQIRIGRVGSYKDKRDREKLCAALM